MPHCTIEYSKPLEAHIKPIELCNVVHKAALASDNFSEADIKVRAKSYDDYLVGGNSKDFIHVIVYLLDGRSEETKKTLTSMILEVLESLNLPVQCLSVDARDTLRSVYSKVQS